MNPPESSAARHHLNSGAQIEWYRIDRLLGLGGFGVTYLATDTNLDRLVAIKEFLPVSLVVRSADGTVVPVADSRSAEYERGLQRFVTEARTLVRFSHPAIVRVHSVFEANNTAYLVMEYENGEDLKTHLSHPGNSSEAHLSKIFLQIADGLQQVHSLGFIHRDIKPANLIVRSDGSPVLLDFGAARPTAQGSHTSFVSAGFTPLEQYQEGSGMQVGPWTDIYALAATLYYAISGNPPVTSTSRLAVLASGAADPLIPATIIGRGAYSHDFLQAIDTGLQVEETARPRSLANWMPQFDGLNVQSDATSEDLPAAPYNSERKWFERPAQNNPQERPSVVPWWRGKLLLSLLLLGVVIVLTVVGVVQWRAGKELQQALRVADNGFQAGDYSEVALPAYRRILVRHPDHQLAQSRIDEIQLLQESLIRRLLWQHRLEAARSAINVYEQSGGHASSVSKFRNDLAKEVVEKRLHSDIERIESLVQSGQANVALEQLSELQSGAVEDSRIVELRQRALAVQERDEHAALQQRQAARNSARLEREQQRRVAKANDRLRERRDKFNQRLAEADTALREGKLEQARRALSIASAYQIDQEVLRDAEIRLKREELFQQQPLSATEFSYAKAQFSALKRALEQRNSEAVTRLTSGSRQTLFLSLLRQYIRISVEVIDVRNQTQPKAATARLKIVDMALSNGDIVYPSEVYQYSQLKLLRHRHSWSKILW